MQLIAKANIHEDLKIFKVENKHGIQSIKVLKNKYDTKVYKKSEHLLEQGYEVENEHLVRFEISTSDQTQKQRLLGESMTVDGLVNNFEKIVQWFITGIRETIKKPVERYLKSMEKECIQRLEQGVKPSVVINELMFRQDLVDLIVFDNAIRKHYKSIGKTKNVSRTIKTTHKRLKELNAGRYNQVTNNIETLQELYDILGI